MQRLTLLLVTCLAFVASGQERLPTHTTRFPSMKYGFSVESPKGWLGGLGPNELPFFFNFPTSKGLGQGLLPKGGATIFVVARDHLHRRSGDDSLVGWANLDQAEANQSTVSSGTLDMPLSTGISQAITVSFDVMTFGPDDQRQHEVNVYWEFRGKMFATYLTYVIGDPKAKEYESLLQTAMHSVRPLRER
jgi:hypothetical protein